MLILRLYQDSGHDPAHATEVCDGSWIEKANRRRTQVDRDSNARGRARPSSGAAGARHRRGKATRRMAHARITFESTRAAENAGAYVTRVTRVTAIRGVGPVARTTSVVRAGGGSSVTPVAGSALKLAAHARAVLRGHRRHRPVAAAGLTAAGARLVAIARAADRGARRARPIVGRCVASSIVAYCAVDAIVARCAVDLIVAHDAAARAADAGG